MAAILSNPKNTKELILETSFSFYKTLTSREFSLNKLAEKVGISKPAIYRHFKNKEEILEKMQEKFFDDFARYLEPLIKNPNDLDKSARDFYKEQREQEENTLLKAVEQIQNVVKNERLDFEYKEKNNRTYSVVSLEKDLTKFEEKMIRGKIDENIYHIEIDNNENGKKVIEIHLKNILDNDLQKESSN